MHGSNNKIPAGLVSLHCTVAPTYSCLHFLGVMFSIFFPLLDQFIHVLISPGALTQLIMSISAQSDSHYVKWCCYTALLMMSQQSHWPFMSSTLAFYGSVKAVMRCPPCRPAIAFVSKALCFNCRQSWNQDSKYGGHGVFDCFPIIFSSFMLNIQCWGSGLEISHYVNILNCIRTN